MASTSKDKFDPATAVLEGGGGSSASAFDPSTATPETGGFVSDLGKSLKAGVQDIPGIATGLADLPFALAAGARPFTKAADAIGEATGFQPGRWSKDTKYSAGYEQGRANIDKAWEDGSAGDIALEYLKNPGYTANQVAQSLPSMALGGVGSKVALGFGKAAAGAALKKSGPGALERAVGEKWAVPLAAGAGEGAITTGQQMAQYEGDDQQRNALAALGAGATTAAIGVGAGRLANKLGLETAETAIAKLGTGATGAADGVAMSAKRRILSGVVSEAVLQEMPQSALEQVWQNYADGKPLMDGVARATVEGGLAGGVMGAGANLRGPGGQVAPENANDPAAEWGTELGAAGPTDPNAAVPAADPDAFDATAGLTSSPGAAGDAAGGMDFQRDINTDGLGLTDPEAEARDRAAGTIDYAPEPFAPDWSTGQGAGTERSGLDMPAREFDTSGLSSSMGFQSASQRMGLNPASGPLSAAAALSVDSGATPVQFLGATGRDMQVRQTGPGVGNDSNVIDVQGRVVDDRAIQTPRRIETQGRLTDQAKQEQGNASANNRTSARLPMLGGPASDVAGRGEPAAGDFRGDAQRGNIGAAGAPGARNGTAGPVGNGGQPNGNAPLSLPNNTRDAFAAIRARRAQEADLLAVPKENRQKNALQTVPPTPGAASVATPDQAIQSQPERQEAEDQALAQGADATPANPAQAGGRGEQAAGVTLRAGTQAIGDPVRLGRGQKPLSEGGKPFSTKAAAGAAKKLQPMMRVVKVDGGFALADKTPKQLAAEQKAAKRLATPNTSAAGEPIPAHAFIAAAGGLSPAVASDLGVDGNPRIGNRTLFAGRGRPGMSIEEATDKLIEDGYLSEGASHNDAYAVIRRSLTQPQFNADGIERIAEAESTASFEDYLAAQQEAADDADFDPFESGAADGYTDGDFDASGFTSADDAIRAEVLALQAQAEAMGIEADPLLEEAKWAAETDKEYYEHARQSLQAAITQATGSDSNVAAGQDGQGRGQEAQPGSAADNRQDDGQQSAPGSDSQGGLAAPTREQVLAQQDRAENADALQQRQQVDREAGNQTLTAQTAPEQRRDNGGDMFAREKADAEIEERNAGRAAKEDPNQDSMFAETPAQAPSPAPAQPAPPAPKAITQADVAAAEQQAIGLIGERIDAMAAGEVNRIAKKFLPTMGFTPTVSKARNKVMLLDPKGNLLASAAELGVEIPAAVKRVLDVGLGGTVEQSQLESAQQAQSPDSFIAAPGGGVDFGEITAEMGKAMRRQAGKIRLQHGVQNTDGTGYGLMHIEARHGNQIRAAGYESIEAFVAESVQDFDQIWQAGDTIQLVVARSGKRGRAVFLQLEIEKDGDFYRVNSAFPVDAGYLAKKEQRENWKSLWSRYPVPADASGASGFAGQSPDAGETAPMVKPLGDVASVADKPAKAQAAKPAKAGAAIDDFGEKLQGARKMLYADAYADGMVKAKELDVKAHPLSKTWPEPDYQKLLEGGSSVKAASIARALREAIPTKPQSAWKLKGWGARVESLRQFSEDILSGKTDAVEVERAMVRVNIRGVTDKAALYEAVGHERSLKGVNLTSGAYSMYEGVRYAPSRTIWMVSRESKGSAFGNWPTELAKGDTRDQAIEAFKKRATQLLAEEQAPTKGATFEIYGKRAGGTKSIYIGKKIGRTVAELKSGFEDVKAARKYLAENQSELEGLLDKYKSVPPIRGDQNTPRIGEDYRSGADVTAEQFQETFQFRGVQFGNYVEGTRRQQDLNRAYDALMDLAGVLNLPARALSLDGRLGLAFGARGTGGVDAAAAHYEPGHVVINLTKKEGAGSLAHEWWHGLDNYFSKQRENKGEYGRADTYLTETASMRGASPGGVRAEMMRAFSDVVSNINRTGMQERSKKLDDKRAKVYWTTTREMSARAFESYVIAKLQDQSAGNDYLANVVNDAVFALEGAYPYPTAGELPAIRAGFDNFFQTVQTKETEQGNVAMFSRTPATTAAYESRIDALFDGRSATVGTRVLDRSDIMGLLGHPDVPLMLNERHLLDGLTSHPEMTAELWKKVPEWLENPAAVYNDPAHPGRLTVIAPERIAGYPVVMAVEPNAGNIVRGKGGATPQEQLLVTVFAKTTGELTSLEGLARVGRLMYADTKKAPVIWQRAGEIPRAGGQSTGAKRILTEKNLAGYRRANEPAASLGEAQAAPTADSNERLVATQMLVDELKSSWTKAPEIIIARNMQDAQIPQAVRDYDAELKSQGSDGEARGFIYDDKVYLLSDELKTPEQIAVVLFHEVLGHFGLRGAFGEALTPIRQQIGTMRRKEVLAKAREYGMVEKGLSDADTWAAMSAKDRASAAEEVLAEMAQTTPNVSFVQRAVAAIRTWLRANVPGFKDLTLTDAEVIRSYILPARGFVTRQNETVAQAVDRAMSAAFAQEPAAPAPSKARNVLAQAQIIRAAQMAGAGPQVSFSRTSPTQQNAWNAPAPTSFDNLVYKMQDKNIDTKRVVEAITSTVGQIKDSLNVYLQEELFHGRAAKRVADFGALELKPMMNQMRMLGVSLDDMEEYLHARHAKEANAVIGQRDPGMPDGGSGMTDAAADAYMSKLPADQRRKMEAVATKVDAIIANTRQLYADYSLEDQAKVDGWGSMFQSYVPLMREGKEGGMGIGQGFTVKGKEVKGRTGSTRKVVDILANIAAQREKVIVRGEKNRVATALVGLAAANPNKDFWEARSQAPTERVYDAASDSVVDRPDSMFKQRTNVVTAKVKDSKGNVTEQAVVFNEDDPRAMRMASSLKNLDAAQLEGLLGVSAKITRYFSAVNTQYNPVFGVVNVVRDVQGAMINLYSTPLADDKVKIAKNTLSALAGIYQDLRAERNGKTPTSKWGKLWSQMQEDGGTTGYRELFTTSADRANDLKNMIEPDAWASSKWGKVFTADGALKVPLSVAKKNASALLGWLSDYNEAMENGVRLAAYSAALDKGMTREQAASLSKNLTVNFNRKGQVSQQAGALYAFFNAAMQGTARIGQTLFTMDGGNIKTLRLSKTGKAIIAGGVTLGVVQALVLAGAGFDDEDPPDFVRERSLVIPTGGKSYISIPMPLGLHVIPGIGRNITEFALSGFKDPAKRALAVIGMMADAFNPIGNAGLSMQTLAPTALDPLVALTENRDWTGKPIARTSSNRAVPGHSQWKDTASGPAKMIAEAINWASGGDQYVAGALSPTPDQIDYLFAQVTGGVGRELSKIEQSTAALTRGEELPTFKVPLVGRFYGDAKSQASEGNAFYANINRLNEIETKAKAMRKDGKGAEASAYLRSQPEAFLIFQANAAERQIQKYKREKRELIDKSATRDEVRAKEEQITSVMARLNRAAEARKLSTQ